MPAAKAVRMTAIGFLVYAGVVVAFESMIVAIGPLRITDLPFPVLVLETTTGASSNARALASLESDGQLFVSANHWPRGWYHRALENPNVQVTLDGETADYLAVPATAEERDRINVEYPFPLVARLLTGFPPRDFLRLDPR